MKTEIAVAVATACLAAVCIWAAWNLAGEPFYACCGVFAAAFCGAFCGCIVWGRIRELDRKNDDAWTPSIIYKF